MKYFNDDAIRLLRRTAEDAAIYAGGSGAASSSPAPKSSDGGFAGLASKPTGFPTADSVAAVAGGAGEVTVVEEVNKISD
jgi:hypothetical protein